jgi:probable rRNA maturation factor
MAASNILTNNQPEQADVIEVEIADEQTLLEIDPERLRAVAEQILAAHGVERGAVSVALVDDQTIHQLNRQYLAHDYPTDVLSFVLEEEPGYLRGQIIASTETAIASAREYGWGADDELLLYIVHAALHLVGMDDHSPEDAAEMRAAEAKFLAPFGLRPRYDDAGDAADDLGNGEAPPAQSPNREPSG